MLDYIGHQRVTTPAVVRLGGKNTPIYYLFFSKMREGFQCLLGTFKERTNILFNNKQKALNIIDENKQFLQIKLFSFRMNFSY